MSLSSAPPPAIPAPSPSQSNVRAPLLAKCGMQAHRDSALKSFLRWCTDRRVSQQDIVRITGLTPKRVWEVFNGEAPLPVEWFYAMSDKDGLEGLGRHSYAIQSRRLA